MEIIFEILDKNKHHKADFDCGEESLNKFIRQYATQHQAKNYSTVYVASTGISNPNHVLGYFTLSNSCFLKDRIANEANKSPYSSIPAIKIGRLARDINLTPKGFGEVLLLEAIERCVKASKTSAAYAIEIDAVNTQVVKFYKKFGFIQFLDNPLSLYIPIQKLQECLQLSSMHDYAELISKS